jgi:hypothetical protein
MGLARDLPGGNIMQKFLATMLLGSVLTIACNSLNAGSEPAKPREEQMTIDDEIDKLTRMLEGIIQGQRLASATLWHSTVTNPPPLLLGERWNKDKPKKDNMGRPIQ